MNRNLTFLRYFENQNIFVDNQIRGMYDTNSLRVKTFENQKK